MKDVCVRGHSRQRPTARLCWEVRLGLWTQRVSHFTVKLAVREQMLTQAPCWRAWAAWEALTSRGALGSHMGQAPTRPAPSKACSGTEHSGTPHRGCRTCIPGSRGLGPGPELWGSLPASGDRVDFDMDDRLATWKRIESVPGG